MNAPLDIRMDNKAFPQWVQGREGRFELERGRVMEQMTGGSRNHSIVIGRFSIEIGGKLDRSNWNICPTEFAAEIGNSVRFPDLLIEPAGNDGGAFSSNAAVVLIEVRSPASVLQDLKTKLNEYTTLPWREAYIVASQDEPISWIWQRSRDDARAFPPEPQEINGRTEAVSIDALGVTIPLAGLYLGIGH
jgi:Uma2 family endonuclease